MTKDELRAALAAGFADGSVPRQHSDTTYAYWAEWAEAMEARPTSALGFVRWVTLMEEHVGSAMGEGMPQAWFSAEGDQ
jgi:hypothetical protein